MSTLFLLLAIPLSASAGACFMRWRIARRQVIAESEDMRDTHIRELLAEVKVTAKESARMRAVAEASRVECESAQSQVKDLSTQLDTLRQQAERAESLLRNEIGEKSELRENLHKLLREKDRLATRAQELELELRMSADGSDLLDPALQMAAAEA